MKTVQVIGLIVLILGILGLIYGGFTYTQETHEAELGPLEFQVKDRERVNIPVWVGVVATVAGGAMLVFGRTKQA